MSYRVKLEFGEQSQTRDYFTVNEARRSADRLAAKYARKCGQATTTVFNRAGEEIYVRRTNAPRPRFALLPQASPAT